MNYRETVGAQIRFELQERDRRLSRLMGREQSTRPITSRRGRIGKLTLWLRSVLRNATDSFEKIQPEIDSTRAARQRTVEQSREAEIATAFHALWSLYDTRSWHREGEQPFRRPAEAPGMKGLDQKRSSLRWNTLTDFRTLYISSNGSATAQEPFEESMAVLRCHNTLTEAGYALVQLSEVALFFENDPLAAQGYLQESLTIFHAAGCRRGIAYSLVWLGLVAFHLEEYEEGKHLAQEGLALCQENGDRWGMAMSSSVVGFCLLEQGDFVESMRVGQECLALCRESGLQRAALNGLLVTGAATCAQREYREARRNLYEALELAVECRFVFRFST